MTGANIMQRVFDCLSEQQSLTVADIAQRTRFSERTIVNALRRLQGYRCLGQTEYRDAQWRYSLREGAQRP